MKYLVDTHYLIWGLIDPDKIEQSKIELLLNPNTIKYVSKISYWEVAVKYSPGKLELSGITPEELLGRLPSQQPFHVRGPALFTFDQPLAV